MPLLSRDQMLDVFRRWQAAVSEPNLEALASLYAPHADIESPMTGHLPGQEGATKAVSVFADAFPERTFTFEEPIIDGARVAVIVKIDGKHVGNFLGLAPTGRHVHFQVVFILDIEDGLIVRDRRIYDFTGVLVQVGVLKAKPL